MLITPAIIFTLSAAAPAHYSLKVSTSSGHVDIVSHNGTLFSWGSFSQLTPARNDPTVLSRDLKYATKTLWIFGSKETRACDDTERCEYVPGAAAWPEWFLCSLPLTAEGSATLRGAAKEEGVKQ